MRTTPCFRTLAVGMFVALAPALASAICEGFKWDVSREQALFASVPIAIAAGVEPKEAPTVEPGRFYRLDLLPQGPGAVGGGAQPENT